MREDEDHGDDGGPTAAAGAATAAGGVEIAIGLLAERTGLPVDTLRTWERRYGLPLARRLPSGHRRYGIDQVERLRLCRQATEAGFRPGDVLGLSVAALRALPGVAGAALAAAPASAHADGVAEADELAAIAADALAEQDRSGHEVDPAEIVDRIGRWLGHVASLDVDRLAGELLQTWQAVGTVAFADVYAAVFLRALGEAWARGHITVAQEHAASERMREVCANQWRGLAAQQRGPAIVVATPPGEQHQLALQLAAAVLTVAGARVIFCGADTPVADIAAAVRQTGAVACAVSVSRFADGERVRAALAALVAALPTDVPLVAGGAGVPTVVGLSRLSSFAELQRWWKELATTRAAPVPAAATGGAPSVAGPRHGG